MSSAERAEPRWRIVVGLGANLGDRLATLRQAAELLAASAGVEALGRSSIVETPPFGGPEQPDYLNAAVLLGYQGTPQQLLDTALGIEQRLGRRRPDAVRWGPRTIDIDLLWAEERVVDLPGLRIPHPRLAERPFALQPLLELCPDAVDLASGEPYATSAAANVELRRVGTL